MLLEHIGLHHTGRQRPLPACPVPAVWRSCVKSPTPTRGAGWGANTTESAQAVLDFVRSEGIFVENVYNSKVLVGMLPLGGAGQGLRGGLLPAYRRLRLPVQSVLRRKRT